MRAAVLDVPGARRDLLAAELARHGHTVTELDETGPLLDAVAGPDAPELVALPARHGGQEAPGLCAAIRASGRDGGPIVVVVGEPGELDVPATLRAGATDVWAVEDPSGSPRDVRTRISLAEHYARLQAEHLRVGGEFTLLRRALDLTGTGFVLTDPGLPDNPIVYANESFVEMTGYELPEVLGRNCRFLQGPDTEPERVQDLRDAVAAERPVTVEIRNRRKDGSLLINEVHVAPVRDERGATVRFVGVQVDVTAYREGKRRLAVERHARRAAEAAERRSAFLAAASPVLDAELDLRSTLESLVHLCVPELADVCVVDVVERGVIERVAVAASDPALERALRDRPRRWTPALDDPLALGARTRRPSLIRDAPERILGPAATRPGTGLSTAVVVPLVARGHVLGVLALGAVDDGERLGEDTLGIAVDLGSRAALALDNARLFERQTGIAAALQEGLLPAGLPEVDGLEIAARYQPAGEGLDIGGDFYDVFPTAAGASMVAVGDVAGKGASAAAITGLARHTLRTAARYEASPSRTLEALNDALVRERTLRGKYCTVAVCRFDPPDAEGRVRALVALAGHPLPLVVRADGAVERAGGPGTLLGWIDDPVLHDRPVVLDPGDALVVYTDGLTDAAERRADGPPDAGLVMRLGGLGGRPAGEVAEALISDAAADDGQDDVAVLVVRATGAAGAPSDVVRRVGRRPAGTRGTGAARLPAA